MKKNITIGLFGMYGLYNFGCEAIVRGTYELIKKAWPDCEVILYTYCPEEDQKVINDLNIKVKHIPIKSFKKVRRIINKIFRVFSIDKQLAIWDAKSVASDCDIVFSVGGDIYTIPKFILDNKLERKHSPIVEFGKEVLKSKPLVIWGASIGPFGENEGVKKYYFDHLKKVNMIFCREEKTLEYLKNNGLSSNLHLCSDPAFYIKNVNKKKYTKGNKLRIALNLSPLSIREQIGENINAFETRIVDTIKELSLIPDCEIILVPHVISPLSEKDNDLTFLKNIYNTIPNNFRKNIKLLESARGFLETKEFLKTCDIVIAARMHCAINAVSEGIPTIFLCYSQKGFGMANYIYGNLNWAIKLTEIDKKLKEKCIEMLYNRDSISNKIKARISEIQSDESDTVNLFKKII